jgi:LytS/YehU family sensor histidine kinase
LQVALELPPDLAALKVPPLILQPLVENAIKHGLEPKVGGGRIEVQAQRGTDQLVLCVRDTGIGVSRTGADDDGARFGLAQVCERLTALYGARASVRLQDAAAGGTEAWVRLPLAAPQG